MTVFRDPAKQEKLNEAIRLGFITRSTDPDGNERFILTQSGQVQWQHEKMLDFMNGMKR